MQKPVKECGAIIWPNIMNSKFLRGVKPRLWCRFQLRKTATLQDLHDAIQDACGWEDSHLFSFATPFGRNAEEIATSIPPNSAFDEPEAPSASKVKLKSYFEYEAQCGYVYDFGDGWQHDVMCTSIVAESHFKWRLIDGKGTPPPEDCSGLWGFESYVSITIVCLRFNEPRLQVIHLSFVGVWIASLPKILDQIL